MTHVAQKFAKAGLFEAHVPRYTSYPAATHFHSGIDSASQQGWIAALPEGSQISLYIHVPFCRRLCWYCACRTQGVTSLSPVVAYADTLLAELALLRQHLPRGITLSHLHFGGGSPTILPPDLVARLTEAVRETAPLAPGAEFSVEIDPAACDNAALDAFAQAGMTRASIGVQDFDEKVQKAIGRLQGYEVTRDIVEGLRARGVNSINVDLVYGLPHQDWNSVRATLDAVLALTPDRLALFGYAHVPWMAKRQKMIDESTLPGPRQRFELFMNAAERLTGSGMQAIGIDHFARPDDSMAVAAREGRLRRNFQGYTDDVAQALIGVGASSISRFAQGYVQNNVATVNYDQSIRAGKLAGVRGFALGLEDKLRARAIEMLMCDFTLDLPALTAEFGDVAGLVARDCARVNDEFPEFVAFDGETLSIPPSARPMTRIIATRFDSYVMAQARHSSAI